MSLMTVNKKKILIFRIFDFLAPLIFGIVFFGWITIAAGILNRYSLSQSVAYFFFIPILIFELLLTAHFIKEKRWKLLVVPRLCLEFCVFFIWVIYSLKPSDKTSWLNFHSTIQIQGMILFLYARPYIFAFLILFSFLFYVILWGKLQKGSWLFYGVLFPLFILFMGYIVFYSDLSGGWKLADVEKQKKVSVIVNLEKFHSCAKQPPRKNAPKLPITLTCSLKFPRCLQVAQERNRLYLSFGSDLPDRSRCPHLMSFTIDGKHIANFEVDSEKGTIREFQITSGKTYFFVSPWEDWKYKIYRLNKNNLEVMQVIDIKNLEPHLKKYALYDILSDAKNNRIFFITGQPPALIRIILSQQYIRVLDLSYQRFTNFGSILHILRYDKNTNRIYTIAVTATGSILFEIDPEGMNIIKQVKLPWVVMSLEVDSIGQEILMGMVLKKGIVVVNRRSFTIKHIIPMPCPFIRRFDIDSKAGLLFVVDHLRGYLYVLKRDSGKVVERYKVGNKPIGMVRIGKMIYVASTLGIIKIDRS